ncbi:MAG: protein kinase [Phycisphaerales bacterium]
MIGLARDEAHRFRRLERLHARLRAMPPTARERWLHRLDRSPDPDARRLTRMLRPEPTRPGPIDRPLSGGTLLGSAESSAGSSAGSSTESSADAGSPHGTSGRDGLRGNGARAISDRSGTSVEPCTPRDSDPVELPVLPAGFTATRPLGVGGSSLVVEAQQHHPPRAVAFKMLARDVTGPRLRARFEAEADILAGLDHPGIASVLATGVLADGRPWLATELVDGARPLDVWARDAAPTAWLRTFADICDAVHHGHGRGVVHRDLKPANILVDSADRPRVIDFGVARLADRSRPTVTRTGEYIGTPRYMSPEQLDADPQAIDVRTDIHALGLVVLQLATGAMPPPLAERIARPPSKADLTRVPPRFRRDLAVMIRTAIAPDPDDRYPAASDLARDVRSLVHRQPIAARRASVPYVVVRALQRHPVTAALAAVGLASIVVAGAVAAESVRRIAASERAAQQENARMRSAVQFFDDAFTSLDPQQDGASLPVAEFLGRAGDRIPGADELDGPMRAELHGLIAGAFERIGVYGEAIGHLDDAIRAAEAPDPITGTVDERRLIRLRLDRVGLLFDLDRLPASQAALDRELAILRARPDWPDLRWEAENEVGVLLLASGRDEEAAEHLSHLREQPLPEDLAFDVAINLSHAWSAIGRARDAADMLDALVADVRRRPEGPERTDRLEGGLRALSNARTRTSDFRAAKAAADEVIEICEIRDGPDHVTTALARHQRATLQLSTLVQRLDTETHAFVDPDALQPADIEEIRIGLHSVKTDLDAAESVYRRRLDADHDWIRSLSPVRSWIEHFEELLAEHPLEN